MNSNIEAIYQFLLQHHIAESYLEQRPSQPPYGSDAVRAALIQGNNRTPDLTGRAGQTRLTDKQIDELLLSYDLIDQTSDNPLGDGDKLFPDGPLANSGFSASLIQKRGTNEYTLAIRSTEILATAKGGDRTRDVFGAETSGSGLAI